MKKLALLFVFLFLISFASAGALDFNKKYFHPEVGEYGKVTIEDWFGLGKQAELTLTENTEYCIEGNCIANIPEFITHEDGVLIEDIRFVGDKPKSYQIYVDDEPYEIGTEMPKGTYDVRIEGTLKILQETDWQIKVSGYWIEEWALWTAADGLTHYWKLDETSGTTAADIGGLQNGLQLDMELQTGTSFTAGGLINNNVNGTGAVGARMYTTGTTFTGLPSGTNQFAVSMWAKVKESGTGVFFSVKQADDNNGIRFINAAGGNIRYFVGGGDSKNYNAGQPQDGSEWTHLILMRNSTNDVSLFVNNTLVNHTNMAGSITTGNFTLFDDFGGGDELFAGIDEVGIWNRSLTVSEINDLYNNGLGTAFGGIVDFGLTVTLSDPPNGDQTINSTVTFEGNFTVTGGNFTNSTLYLWNPDSSLFGTNFTEITGNTTNTSKLDLSSIPTGNGYMWNYWVCGTNVSDYNCSFATSNFTFDVAAFTVDSETFETDVFETSRQNFSINITTVPSILSVTASLNYNGTLHLADVSCTAPECTISREIDIPQVQDPLASQNKSFKWELSIFDGSISVVQNSSEQQHNVSRIYLEQCNTTFVTQTLNFTVYDERNLSRIQPFNFNGDFDAWLGSGTEKRNNSFSKNVTEMNLCFSPNSTMMLDATIDYDERDNSTAYTNRFYYFDNKTVTNVSEDIFMYLLPSASSTSFILKVQDENLLPVADALIEIHRFYPGEGIFRIVQIAKTDDNGKSIGFFETETVDYKFIIKKAGETLLETGTQKVVPETSPFTLTFNTGTNLGEPWASQNEITDLQSSLSWDPSTGIVTYIYVDTSGNFTQARLLVVEDSLTNITSNDVICNTTSLLSSASLTCSVGNSSGFYTASSFITRVGEGLDLQITFQIEDFSSQVGVLGLFYGIFLILIAGFMFKFNEIAGIWAVTVAIFLVNIMGLIKFGAVFVSAIIGIAVILTWVMER